MEIIINGKDCQVLEPADSVHFEALCLMSGRQSVSGLTITFSLPDGRSGNIPFDSRAPLVDGAIYNIVDTGSA